MKSKFKGLTRASSQLDKHLLDKNSWRNIKFNIKVILPLLLLDQTNPQIRKGKKVHGREIQPVMHKRLISYQQERN